MPPDRFALLKVSGTPAWPGFHEPVSEAGLWARFGQVWTRADPEPLRVVRDVARRLHLDLGRYDRKGPTFARVEAVLMRRRSRVS